LIEIRDRHLEVVKHPEIERRLRPCLNVLIPSPYV
jgi:hypothetical protein